MGAYGSICHWTVTDSRESNFRYFENEKLHENSTKFEIAPKHISWDRGKSLNEKSGVKKSCHTVPLS
jgi:hypothetical protein